MYKHRNLMGTKLLTVLNYQSAKSSGQSDLPLVVAFYCGCMLQPDEVWHWTQYCHDYAGIVIYLLNENDQAVNSHSLANASCMADDQVGWSDIPSIEHDPLRASTKASIRSRRFQFRTLGSSRKRSLLMNLCALLVQPTTVTIRSP